MERCFGNRRITLYASGTAALAQAIAACAARTAVSSPEVILPAYGCPDLVAASVYAGVLPRLVDVAPSSWSYDAAALEATLSPNTVGIIAVNLLGLGDQARDLARLCQERRIGLIQDSAQFLPREPIDWPGEYVVLSFGRGKPLNLLGGGALVSPPGTSDLISTETARLTLRDRLFDSRAAAIAFNALTRPHAYRLYSALPGTGLGKVTYSPLHDASPRPERSWRRLGRAFGEYCGKPSYRSDIWETALREWADFGITPLHSPDAPFSPEPLRLALLAPDEKTRDSLVDRLNANGLGASRFYGTALPEVACVPQSVRAQGPFPNASSLAGKLFTLPTHGLVTATIVESARRTVHTLLSNRLAPRGTPTPLAL